MLPILAASVICDPSIAIEREDLVITTTVSETSTGFVGRITLETPTRSFAPRTVEAASCEGIRDALRLIAALAVEHIPPYEPPEPSRPIATGVAQVSSPLPLRIEPRWHFGLGVQATGTYGVGPTLAPSGAPFLELVRDPLSLRATLLFAHTSQGIAVSFAAARLEACPFHAVFGDFELDPCVNLEVGAVHGRAAEARTSAWIAPGIGGRARWRFSHPYFAEIEAGAGVPILRPRFYLAPDVTLWEAPLVAVHGSAGLGVYLW